MSTPNISRNGGAPAPLSVGNANADEASREAAKKGYDMFNVMESGVLTDRTSSDDDDDYDHTQPKTAVFILETEADRLSEQDEDHIRDYFRMRCHCAHDCCGHRNGGVSIISRMWSHRYIVVVHSSLNF